MQNTEKEREYRAGEWVDGKWVPMACEACGGPMPDDCDGTSAVLCNPCWNLALTMGRHMDKARAVLEWLSNH
jgi:hypothetical protein